MARLKGGPDPPSRCHLPAKRDLGSCVAFGRFSRSTLRLSTGLRRITYTPQSALLPRTTAGSTMRRLASNTLLEPRALQNPLSLVHKQEFDGGFREVHKRHVFEKDGTYDQNYIA